MFDLINHDKAEPAVPETRNVPAVYELQGMKFNMLPFNLGLLNKAAPLLIRYRKLQYEYLKDIDMKKLEEINLRISDLKTALKQVKENICPDKKLAAELELKIKETENQLEENPELRSLIRLINDCRCLALYELITDQDVIKPVLNKILICTAIDGKKYSIDSSALNSPGAAEFIKNVITDFFSLIQKNNPQLTA